MIKILKTATLLLAGITLAIIAVCIGITIKKKNVEELAQVTHKVKNMAKVIAFNLNKDNPYFITRKDLDKITHIGIGPTNNYDTIVDLAKCKNLKVFVLNDYDYGFGEFFLAKDACQMSKMKKR